MRADIIRIGNSKGIRIPATLLKQCGIDNKVEIEIRYNNIILKPIKSPRDGWGVAFRKMSKQGDDLIIISDELDTELMEEWDK